MFFPRSDFRKNITETPARRSITADSFKCTWKGDTLVKHNKDTSAVCLCQSLSPAPSGGILPSTCSKTEWKYTAWCRRSCRCGETVSLNCGQQQACCSSRRICIRMEPRWNDTGRGNWRTRRETWPSATLCTTNPTRTDPGANQVPLQWEAGD
jgi:hypothetical protein